MVCCKAILVGYVPSFGTCHINDCVCHYNVAPVPELEQPRRPSTILPLQDYKLNDDESAHNFILFFLFSIMTLRYKKIQIHTKKEREENKTKNIYIEHKIK